MDLNSSIKVEKRNKSDVQQEPTEASVVAEQQQQYVDPYDKTEEEADTLLALTSGRCLVADASVQVNLSEESDARVDLKATALQELEEDIAEARQRYDALQRQMAALQEQVNAMTTLQLDEVSRRQLEDMRWRALDNHLSEDRRVLTTVVNCVNSLQHVLSVMPHHVRKEIERVLDRQQRVPSSPAAAASRTPNDNLVRKEE